MTTVNLGFYDRHITLKTSGFSSGIAPSSTMANRIELYMEMRNNHGRCSLLCCDKRGIFSLSSCYCLHCCNDNFFLTLQLRITRVFCPITLSDKPVNSVSGWCKRIRKFVMNFILHRNTITARLIKNLFWWETLPNPSCKMPSRHWDQDYQLNYQKISLCLVRFLRISKVTNDKGIHFVPGQSTAWFLLGRKLLHS